MKINSSMKIFQFAFLLVLFGCSSEKSENSDKKQERKSLSIKEENSKRVSKLLTEKFCFVNKTEECTEEEGKFVYCRVELEIKGTEVNGTSNCIGCGGNGDGILKGYRKGDSLFLDDIYMEPDGAESKLGTIWLLQENKLLQLQTVEINGKSKIEDPDNSMVIFAFDKVECK